MNTFNYTSSLVILFSLIQNFIEINNSNYIFNIIYLSTIIIFLLLKKYKKNYNISINIIVYISLFISNIYLFFYKNNKEKILEGNDNPSDLCKDIANNNIPENMFDVLNQSDCNKTDVQPTTGTANSCPTGVSPKNEVEADACSGIEVIGDILNGGNEGINNFFNNVNKNCKPITCDETNGTDGTDKTNETGETVQSARTGETS